MTVMHLVITNGQENVDPANNWRICCSKWSYCYICPCRWQLVHLDYRQFILLNSITYISSISPYCSVCTIMTASKQQWKRWHTWDLITVLWYFTSTTVASAFISHITENARLRHIKTKHWCQSILATMHALQMLVLLFSWQKQETSDQRKLRTNERIQVQPIKIKDTGVSLGRHAWNNLPVDTDFSSPFSFKRQINRLDCLKLCY